MKTINENNNDKKYQIVSIIKQKRTYRKSKKFNTKSYFKIATDKTFVFQRSDKKN